MTEDQGIVKMRKTPIAWDTNIQTRNIKIRTFCNCAKTWKSETPDSRDSLVASAPVASDAKTPAVMRI